MSHPFDAVTLDRGGPHPRLLDQQRAAARAGGPTSLTRRSIRTPDALAGRRRGLALEPYDWRSHADDAESYWLNIHRAAELLGISRLRLGQLGDKGFVPFVRHRDGVRLYRREQLLTVANARDARWH